MRLTGSDTPLQSVRRSLPPREEKDGAAQRRALATLSLRESGRREAALRIISALSCYTTGFLLLTTWARGMLGRNGWRNSSPLSFPVVRVGEVSSPSR